MKITLLLLLVLSLTFSTNAYNLKSNIKVNHEIYNAELNEVLNEVLDVDENKFAAELQRRNKIVIIDGDFNKIREETVDKLENLNNQSMLVPFIYRSQFITKVHNVSYYMLEKQ